MTQAGPAGQKSAERSTGQGSQSSRERIFKMQTQRSATHWIDGEWVEGGTKKDSINPANGKSIGTYFDGDAKVAQSARAAAGAAVA